MGKEVTVTITAFNRPDLLELTLDSFLMFNTYPVKRFIITDDSGIEGCNEYLVSKYSHLDVVWIYNKKRIGQIRSIDNMYAMVDTDYIFHMEEDWEFLKAGFMEKSIQALESDPLILLVQIRGQDDMCGIPILKGNELYDYVSKGFRGVWHGFSFNPGLRRLFDYNLVENYTQWGGEPDISVRYNELGFHAVILKDKYIRHTGAARHTNGAGEAYNG